MVDLREYKDMIRQLVSKANENDKNWKWSVKSITKSKVAIRWGYLDYMEEKNNCFFLVSENNDISDDWLWARTPSGDIIDCYMVAKVPNPRIGAEITIEGGIRSAIEEIEYYAHSRY